MDLKEQIIQILQKQFTEMEKMAKHYHNNPYHPKNIHQYRVHMRRMRSVLNFIKPIIREDIYKEINGLLRKQGKDLSPLRDIDVFIEKLNKTAESQPNLLDNYADVFHFLQKERLKIINTYSSEKNNTDSNKTMLQVKNQLTKTSFFIENKQSSNFVEKRFDKLYLKLKKEYVKIADSDYEHIHETRKLAKKTRYNAEGYKKLLPRKETKKAVKYSKKVQADLGVVTDAHVHTEILKFYCNKVEDIKLKASFEKLLSHYAN